MKKRGGKMRVRSLIGVLLVLVMLSSVMSPVMAKPTKTGITKNLSPSDLIDMKEINKYLESMSKEEIKKKYEEAVRKANEQYEKAVKKQDELVKMIVKSKKKFADNEINTLSVRSGYYHSDPTADGGTADHGGWGVGYSDAYINGNEIHVFSRAWVAGSYWATGRVWDVFTYNAPSHWCKITINYYLRGLLLGTWVPSNPPYPGWFETRIDVYLRVYDHTENREVVKKKIFSDEISSIAGKKWYDEIKSGYVYTYLKKGHKYTIELIGEVKSNAQLMAICYSDFHSQQFNGEWRFIKWSNDVVEWS